MHTPPKISGNPSKFENLLRVAFKDPPTFSGDFSHELSSLRGISKSPLTAFGPPSKEVRLLKATLKLPVISDGDPSREVKSDLNNPIEPLSRLPSQTSISFMCIPINWTRFYIFSVQFLPQICLYIGVDGVAEPKIISLFKKGLPDRHSWLKDCELSLSFCVLRERQVSSEAV